jgi:transcriptional regulator with XRE-family HTH domain
VVRKLRLERGWTVSALAEESGLRVRSIRLIESPKAPATMHFDTVKRLAEAFGEKRDHIAEPREYDPDLDDDDVSGAPPKSTLAMRAARDAMREWAATASGQRYELVRPRLLHRIQTAPGLCTDRRFAITGKVRDHRDMPAIVGRVLGSPSTVCAQFLLARRVDTGDACYSSIFTTTADQTAQMLDFAERKKTATVIARIFIKEPENEFKGFFFFGKKGEKPKAYKWAFVVDEVLTGEVTVTYGESENIATNSPEKPKPSKNPVVGGPRKPADAA